MVYQVEARLNTSIPSKNRWHVYDHTPSHRVATFTSREEADAYCAAANEVDAPRVAAINANMQRRMQKNT
jgi:hypothetical protein